MARQVFKESQDYRGTWVMYLILMVEVPMVILVFVFLQTGNSDSSELTAPLLVIFSVLGLTFLLIMSIRLESRIDDQGVHYRFVPFINKWRTIPKSKINSIELITYAGITEYGGWGIKGNKTTKAYSIIGDKGLLIDSGEKKKVMIGTGKESELRAFLRYWQEDNYE